MSYPTSDPKYGEVVHEYFVETDLACTRVALLETKKGRVLCIQKMWGTPPKFGKAIHLPIADVCAEEVLIVATGMLQDSEEEDVA